MWHWMFGLESAWVGASSDERCGYVETTADLLTRTSRTTGHVSHTAGSSSTSDATCVRVLLLSLTNTDWIFPTSGFLHLLLCFSPVQAVSHVDFVS